MTKFNKKSEGQVATSSYLPLFYFETSRMISVGVFMGKDLPEVLIPIIRRLPRGRRDFLSVAAPLQTLLSSSGFGRLACGW